MDLSLLSKVFLYIIIIVFGLLVFVVLWWQIMVLRGKSMPNPDGTFDDWHDQKLFFGIAIADVFVAIPITLAGICLIFLVSSVGYFLTALGALWFLWANIMTTATSLRFEKPRITFSWFMVFPFGALIGLAYIIWTFLHLNLIFRIGGS